jgi:serine/threonine-protein kinase HipA
VVGNEDMHLKNFSLISKDNKIELSPAYDLLNTTLAIPQSHEEMALPIRGKKNKLKKEDFMTYYGREILDLPEKVIQKTFDDLHKKLLHALPIIEMCFLKDSSKQLYKDMVLQRLDRLQ